MAVAIHENVQNLALVGPALGYGASLLISWFGKKTDSNSKPVNVTAIRNYEAAVKR